MAEKRENQTAIRKAVACALIGATSATLTRMGFTEMLIGFVRCFSLDLLPNAGR